MKKRKTRIQKIKSAKRIELQKAKQKEILDKKENLVTLKRELKNVKRKNNLKKTFLISCQLAPILLSTFLSKKRFELTRDTSPIKEIIISEDGYENNEIAWCETIFDKIKMEQSELKYIGNWQNIPECPDILYRIKVDMNDKGDIEKIINAYETNDMNTF